MLRNIAKSFTHAVLPTAPIPIYVRYAIPADKDRIHAINCHCAAPILEQGLARSLADPNIITRVAVRAALVEGFAQYRVFDDRLELRSLAVDADMRRKGVGRALADDAKAALKRTERPRLAFVVPEADLGALLFWRAVGVRATGIQRDWFAPGCDGFAFEYTVPDPTGIGAANCPSRANDVP
jgi:ribosomal protein S18 acetylase RimI-like enzyme